MICMEGNIESKIVNHLTLEIMNDSKFVCNPHIRVRCAWIEAKKVFDGLTESQKNKILNFIEGNDEEFHLPDFWD